MIYMENILFFKGIDVLNLHGIHLAQMKVVLLNMDSIYVLKMESMYNNFNTIQNRFNPWHIEISLPHIIWMISM